MNAPLRILSAVLCVAPLSVAQAVSFQSEVLPILSDRCFPCHGPDAKVRQAGLRLDTQESALRAHDPVIVPGRSDASALMGRIAATAPGQRMPPPESNLALTAQEVETLRRWIDQGAPWGRHWAFVEPRAPDPPAVADGVWGRNPIDRFVLARLEREGMRPAQQASRGELLRRVTLDLTGVPPTLQELDAFLADESTGAYERVVDRLLASPRYGERMAWEWLDAARYADTDGFQADPTRTMWPWRDWLIRSLNDNLPFDRFTREALAGDLIPDASPEQVVASGFNRNHMYNGEGGRIAEETRVENVFDRTETTSTVWLGLTMTCARCHDHKYDPISQEEYYGLSAFFNQTSESGAGGSGRAPPTVRYQSPEQRAGIARIDQDMAALQARMVAPDPRLDAGQGRWEAETADRLRRSGAALEAVTLDPWQALGPLAPPGGDIREAFAHAFGPERGVDLSREYDGGKRTWREAPQWTDGKPHALDDAPGATYLYRVVRAPSAREVEVSLGSDDTIQLWLNGESLLAKNVNRGVLPDQERVRLTLAEGRNELLLKIVNTGGRGGFYFKKLDETVEGMSEVVVRALLRSKEDRDDEQRRVLMAHYREEASPDWRVSARALEKLRAERKAAGDAVATVMIMDSLPGKRRRRTRVLDRGAYDRPLREVSEGTPAFLPPMDDGAAMDRMGLARWLTTKDNPLTARVTVNRHWQTFFGRGLVATTENFGQQGALPSHPGLLDWLAVTFVDGGWDVKALHRLMVTSATYRQSSRVPRAAYEEDPDNVRLARGPRHRLPSWMIRDQALALSGLLVEKLGGPSVRPYQPAGVWAEATFGKIRYRADRGDDLYRRSLYVFWRRIVGPTVFFDTSKRQACVVKQTRTNSPLHALTTLNETAYVEAARAYAAVLMTSGDGALEERVAVAFRMATCRTPAPEESTVLVNRWRDAHARFSAAPAEADRFLGVGAAPRDEGLDAVDHAAWTVICSMILNLDEVLCKP